MHRIVQVGRERRRGNDPTFTRSSDRRIDLILVEDYPTTAQNKLWSTVNLQPLKDVKVNGLQVGLVRDGFEVVGVPDEDVGVGADRNLALAGIHPQGLGCV